MGEFGSQPFDRKRHDRSQFDCGEPSLDRWLREQASQAVRRGSAQVYVRCGELGVVSGYVALAMTSVESQGAPREVLIGALPIPAVLIARLAVDRRFQGTGIGRELLLDAVRAAVDASALVGACMIVVDALDDEAARFYRRHGFADLRNLDTSRRLWIPMTRARASL